MADGEWKQEKNTEIDCERHSFFSVNVLGFFPFIKKTIVTSIFISRLYKEEKREGKEEYIYIYIYILLHYEGMFHYHECLRL